MSGPLGYNQFQNMGLGPLMGGGQNYMSSGYPSGYGLPMRAPGANGGQAFLPFFLQMMQMMQQTQAANDQRLAEKSATFDPMSYYQTPGAPPPHLAGMSAMQRWRDMSNRQLARAEAAKAAVEAVKAKQAAEAAMTQEEKDAASGILREKIQISGGDARSGGKTATGITTPYGVGHNVPMSEFVKPPVKSMYIGPKGGTPLTGESLKEVFRRASNAGSPNAGVGVLPSPEAGYPGGGPMSAADLKLWELAMKK